MGGGTEGQVHGGTEGKVHGGCSSLCTRCHS